MFEWSNRVKMSGEVYHIFHDWNLYFYHLVPHVCSCRSMFEVECSKLSRMKRTLISRNKSFFALKWVSFDCVGTYKRGVEASSLIPECYRCVNCLLSGRFLSICFIWSPTCQALYRVTGCTCMSCTRNVIMLLLCELSRIGVRPKWPPCTCNAHDSC